MAVNNKSLENLKPIKKGEVRNAKGKVPGTLSAKSIIKRWLSVKEDSENPITGDIEKLTQLDIITIKQILKAKAGDTGAFNALLDRAEGKPRQVSDLNLSGSQNTQPTYIFKMPEGIDINLPSNTD